MIRVIIENVLLFLAPTFIYLVYVWLSQKRAADGAPQGGAMLDDAPLLWLFFAGALLVIATLIAFGSLEGGKPGDVYTPPVVRDGRIVPGHLDPQQQQQKQP